MDQSRDSSVEPQLHSTRGEAGNGRVLIPDHELIRLIGRGSYGEVWLARSVLGTLRAVKIVSRASFGSGRPYEREFSGILRVEPLSRAHEGLVDILHVGRREPEGYFYYVMELADNAAEDAAVPAGRDPDLAHYRPRTLTRALKSQGRLPFEQCVQLGLTLSSALSCIHQGGLVHRDVKPSNVLYVNGVAKLGDIGLVDAAGESASYVGTEGYIPPEGPGTPQADVFGLGKVLYEASTGRDRLEFPALPESLGEGASAAQLAELNAVFLRACAPDPRERYQNAEEFHADIALLHRGQSVRRQRQTDRRWKQLKHAGFVGAALAGLAVGAWWSPRQLPGSGTKAAHTASALPLQQQAVDLKRFCNAKLDSSWTQALPGNDLATLPKGWNRLGPAHFEIFGLIQVSGGFLESRNMLFPAEVRGIPVNRKCARLYFLHGTIWLAEKGATVGHYLVRYADGKQVEIPLRYGEQLQNWWWSPVDNLTLSGAAVAWIGTNTAVVSRPESKLCLYAIEWNNPFPGVPVTSIDFSSTRGPACPFLLAITSE